MLSLLQIAARLAGTDAAMLHLSSLSFHTYVPVYLCEVQDLFKKPQALLSKVLLKQQQCLVFRSFQELQECVLPGTTRKH